MEQITMTFSASLLQAQFGTIAAANIALAFYRQITTEKNDEECEFADAVELAVGEACTNSVKYCPTSKAAEQRILLIFEFGERELIIHIQDCNPPFHFDAVPDPPFEQIPVSGYGIHIMKKSMDQVSYRYENGWNIVTMKKQIDRESANDLCNYRQL